MPATSPPERFLKMYESDVKCFSFKSSYSIRFKSNLFSTMGKKRIKIKMMRALFYPSRYNGDKEKLFV